MNPSPFQIAQNVAQTFGSSQERQRDLSAIDEILTQANESGNQEDVNAAMGQILSRVSPERQPQAMKILQDKMSGIKEQKKFENQQVLKQQALEEGRSFKQRQVEEKRGFETQEEERKKKSQRKALIDQGLDPSIADLPTSVANKVISDDIKREEKNEIMDNALGRVNKMREIRNRKLIGRGSAVLGSLGGKTTKDREEFEQLGKSLISFATSIPIRNRLEFETLSEKLRNPSMTLSAIDGVLDAMERIIKGSIVEKQKKVPEGSLRIEEIDIL